LIKNYDIGKVPSTAEVKKRIKDVYAKIVVIISGLIKGLASMRPEDLEKWSDMISDREFLINASYFQFEVNRYLFCF
jgi:hypothetical protein